MAQGQAIKITMKNKPVLQRATQARQRTDVNRANFSALGGLRPE